MNLVSWRIMWKRALWAHPTVLLSLNVSIVRKKNWKRKKIRNYFNRRKERDFQALRNLESSELNKMFMPHVYVWAVFQHFPETDCSPLAKCCYGGNVYLFPDINFLWSFDLVMHFPTLSSSVKWQHVYTSLKALISQGRLQSCQWENLFCM